MVQYNGKRVSHQDLPFWEFMRRACPHRKTKTQRDTFREKLSANPLEGWKLFLNYSVVSGSQKFFVLFPRSGIWTAASVPYGACWDKFLFSKTVILPISGKRTCVLSLTNDWGQLSKSMLASSIPVPKPHFSLHFPLSHLILCETLKYKRYNLFSTNAPGRHPNLPSNAVCLPPHKLTYPSWLHTSYLDLNPCQSWSLTAQQLQTWSLSLPAQQLQTLAALPVDPNLIPSTYMSANIGCNYIARESNCYLWPLWHCVFLLHRPTYRQNTY